MIKIICFLFIFFSLCCSLISSYNVGTVFKLNHKQQDVQKIVSGLYIDTLKNYYNNWYHGYELTLNFSSKNKIYKYSEHKKLFFLSEENPNIQSPASPASPAPAKPAAPAFNSFSPQKPNNFKFYKVFLPDTTDPYLVIEEKHDQLNYIYSDKKLYDIGINKKFGYFFNPIFVYIKCGFIYEPHLIKNYIYQFNERKPEYFYNKNNFIFHAFRYNLNMGLETKIYDIKYRIEFERSYPLVNKKINNSNILKINNELKFGMSYNF